MRKKSKFPLKSTFWLVAIFISVSVLPVWITAGKAITFRPPGDDAPTASTGGASRDGGSCVANNGEFTPIVPKTNFGLTVAAHPTVYAYIPQTTAKKAFFSIEDENTNHLYQTTLNLPAKPGVIGIKIPESATALKTLKNYKWSLVMICGEYLEPDSPSVNAWIRRVEQPELPVSEKSVSKLASNGIWYDAISELAQLRNAQPENSQLTQSWTELLQSVGLEKIATKPLINQ